MIEFLTARLNLTAKNSPADLRALGVGVGVDYAIYLYNRLESYFRQGMDLKEAYEHFGLRYSINLLIVDPFPAESLPSKTIATLFLFVITHS